MVNFEDRNSPLIVEIAVRLGPTEFSEEQQNEITFHIAKLLEKYGADIEKIRPCDFRNEWTVDMEYDGG